jgi:hypothetical protein
MWLNVRDLSIGGVFLDAVAAFADGTMLKIDLHLHGELYIETRAMVIHHRHHGFGCHFLEMPWEARKRLVLLVAEGARDPTQRPCPLGASSRRRLTADSPACGRLGCPRSVDLVCSELDPHGTEKHKPAAVGTCGSDSNKHGQGGVQ